MSFVAILMRRCPRPTKSVVSLPLFSTIIPVYNREQFLPQTLDSVLAQEFADQEIICVDDGSTDGSVAVIEAYADRGVQLIRQQNQGPGVARNTGAAAAIGEYLAFLDSDDVWFPWTLRVYVEAIEANHQPALLSGKLMPVSDDADASLIKFGTSEFQAYIDFLASSRDGHYCGSGQAVVRRDVFLKSGGFTERRINAEDHDFVLRIGTEAGFVHVAEPTMVGYRQHAGALTGNAAKTTEGILYLLQQEYNGSYPGGRKRQADRRRILSQHVRPVSLSALKQGNRRVAWELYRKTLKWHLQFGRFRYLAGFAALAMGTQFRRTT
jgi:glycosyltransferase involved in cell wall biosynthesis